MPRPAKEPPSPSALVPALIRHAQGRGLDAASLVARAGLPLDTAERDEVDVTATAVGDLLDAVEIELGEPYAALSLPVDLPFRRYGAAELVARASTTVREALVGIARYATLVLPRLECELREADPAEWHQRIAGHPRGIGRAAHEYGLAYALTQCRKLSGLVLPATRAWFAHARPRDLGPLHRFFGTRDLSFGEEDSGFSLPGEALDARLASGDSRLLATMQDLADAALRAQPREQRFGDLVAARLEPMLGDGPGLEEVASALHMSARTLQRRLDQEGTRFSEVLDGVREKVGRSLVKAESVPLTEVAYRLGFSDLATFSRAFKRWTGKPPGTWRRSG